MARERGTAEPAAKREWRAVHRYARSSAQKARLVIDRIRGRDIEEAQRILKTTNKKAALLVDRVLRSAIANADTVGRVDVERLYVSKAVADGATIWKRWRPGPRGRSLRIRKPTCHIEVVVAERTEEEAAGRTRRRGGKATAGEGAKREE